MKKFRNLVIGGIENKVFNLILAAVVLITAAFLAAAHIQNKALTQLSEETTARQQASITEITTGLMDTVVEQSLTRSTVLEAMIADELFHGLETRVRMLGEYAGKLFSDPSTPAAPYAAPDPARSGEVTAQLILAADADAADPALAAGLGVAANLSDMMISLFGASELTNSCFIALPEGAFLVTDDRSAAKFGADGAPVAYDPRTRPWYRQAVEAGGLVFTDVETDAFTGDIGIVCAMPVYVGGRLAAVVGSDLFLTAMQTAVQASMENGGYIFIVNRNGHAVFSPMEEGDFRVLPAGQAQDLRQSENKALAALIADAMQAATDVRTVELPGGSCYMTGAPLGTVGWALIAVFSREMAAKPAEMLREGQELIRQEAVASYRDRAARTQGLATFLLLVIAAALLAGTILLGKRIVRPLNAITNRIAELDEAHPEFTMTDAYRTGDEIEVLAESFARLSRKTLEYVDEVKRVTAEKERVGTELKLGHDIQVNMLPNIFPPFPDRTEFDIYATMTPAREVGGDFYDFYLVDDRHLVMVIADVSGKGIPAAMFMMASKIIISNISSLGVSDPAEILEAANRQITGNNPAEMFVTVWLGILDLTTGRLSAANAGHEYPFVMRRGGRFEMLKDRHGFVLGGMEGSRYHTYTLQLSPGDAVFVYTDGAAEATDAANGLFGTARLADALNRDPDASCRELLANVQRAIDGFVQDAPQFDDTTMMAVRYVGKGGEA